MSKEKHDELLINERKSNNSEFISNKQIDGMDLAVLNCYRNKYYTDGNSTEQGIIANAINEVLPILVSLKNGDYRKQSEGRWKQEYNNYPRYVCTNCNHLFNNKNFKYCPNCGAKMKGGAEE